MAQSVTISRADMTDFLTARGFSEVPANKLPGTKERVFAKSVDGELVLRVYTSVVGDYSRDNGKDAIRLVLVSWATGEAKIIGSEKRVHRVVGWRANLDERLASW